MELVDARPSDALNLAALLSAPIVVAPDVLAYAQATLEGDSPEATRLRCAVEAEQMILQPSPAGDRSAGPGAVPAGGPGSCPRRSRRAASFWAPASTKAVRPRGKNRSAERPWP